MTVTEYLRRLQRNIPFFTQQQCLQVLIDDAFLNGRILYSGDGHPIPRSSYLPHKGDLSGTLS